MGNMSSLPESLQAAADREQWRKLLLCPPTDSGNGEAFADCHGLRFRYNHSRGLWELWNGRYWAGDNTAEAERAALDTVRQRQLAAVVLIQDTDARKEQVDWAIRSESVYAIKAMLKSAQSIRSLATTAADYDRAPFLLTVGNGTLDLRTRVLRPFDPSDLITKATDVIYDPKAKAPRWEQFLQEIFQNDRLLIEFVQRAVGYSLTGDVSEQCLFILHGEGANGKSTFLEISLRLLGTHAAITPLSLLLVQNPGAPRNDVARLHGTRFVKAAESQKEAVLDEAIVKELTGGDTISARFLFQEFFEFRPQFKLWIATNHLFKIRGTETAIWRRLRIISFRQAFTGQNRDSRLREKLEAELSGILTWAVEGCRLWQLQGLGNAPKVEKDTNDYRLQSDQLGRFLTERCTTDAQDRATGGELFQAYLGWCQDRGEKPESNNGFAKALVDRNILKRRTKKGVVYVGISPIPRAGKEAIP